LYKSSTPIYGNLDTICYAATCTSATAVTFWTNHLYLGHKMCKKNYRSATNVGQHTFLCTTRLDLPDRLWNFKII